MIRCKPKEYAQALLQSLEAAPQREKEILKNFAETLTARRDLGKWRRILEIFEKMYIAKSGEKYIEVYLARDDSNYRKMVEKTVSSRSRVTFKVDPSLLGGIRFLINKEILIDGSVQRRINKLLHHK